jgi:predicted Fe-S protein YdhL (DUF1289 family)
MMTEALENEDDLRVSCERCVKEYVLTSSTFCRGCSRTVDRLIAQYVHAELNDIEIGREVGLSQKAVAQRKTRMRKRGEL